MPTNSSVPDPRRQANSPSLPGGCDDVLDAVVADLYNLASMLVGEGEESIELVEAAVVDAGGSACDEPDEARYATRSLLIGRALQRLSERDSAALTAPEGFEPAQTCIEDDDLSSAGLSRHELEQWMSGSERGRVRSWLESLPTATRIIFVLRAVAEYSTPETAGMLAEYGGPGAANWTPDAVREFFRQGLCSLASQLIQAQSKQ